MRKPEETTILTVEDDSFVRDVFVAFLEDCGFQVLEAENGRLGLEIFRREKPDLILIDLRMPEVDGLEVLATVTRESPDTPAIVVSGMGTIGDAIKALKFGAWDYIAKPIHDMAVLEHSVNRALERADLIQENRLYREHLEDEVKKRTAELERAYGDLQQEVAVRKQAEDTVSKVNLELTMLSECIHAVVRATDEEELVGEVCRIIVEVGGHRMAWVGFVDADDAEIVRPIAWACQGEEDQERLTISWDGAAMEKSSTGRAIRKAQPVVHVHDSTGSPLEEEAVKDGFGAAVALPLQEDGRVFGALSIYAEAADTFDPNETQRLKEVADDLAYGIVSLRVREERNRATVDLQANLDKLQKALEGTIKVVASTVEVRDPYTAGHQRRVATLARRIGEEMSLSVSQLEGIYMAGLVHDLGKIYVPAEILSKPSQLSEIEFNLIRTHPQVGHDLLSAIEFPWPIAQIVFQHHEKVNGTGYPAGLTGDQILLEAKIITVADVVEAMASHRPYRPSLGIERALEQITENRGTLYDPRVVDICLQLFAEGHFAFD